MSTERRELELADAVLEKTTVVGNAMRVHILCKAFFSHQRHSGRQAGIKTGPIQNVPGRRSYSVYPPTRDARVSKDHEGSRVFSLYT